MCATVVYLVLLIVLAEQGPPLPIIPAEEKILASLRPGHPRLLAPAEDTARLKKLLAEDATVAAFYKQVRSQAEALLRDKRTVEYKLVGPRLLGESRRCLDRVYTLATVYRLEGDRRYAERAIQEMLAAAQFSNWNPSHFLDTAEMTHALAIGYDWLFEVLTGEQRQTIREAILRHGLREGEKIYRRGGWWTVSQYNWNQVCNGGMTIGALALADEEPKLAAYILHQAVQSVQRAMKEYAPDGAWAEGPGYWNYATSYNVFMLAALETALGTDFGLSKIPGFSVAGDFRIHTLGPTGQAFNFADAGPGAGSAPCMFWLARKFNQPWYAWHEREVVLRQLVRRPSPLHLWWYDPRPKPAGSLPLARHFRHADVVLMRSGWEDPAAVFVGFKAGDNKVNHSHLELGMFVLEADGVRWALDLGADDYNLPGYFGRQRWTYYRLGTEGQNTLWIDQKNQDPQAVAPIVAFGSQGDRHFAVADLSAAYAGLVDKAYRGIALLGRQVLIQDEIEQCQGRTIQWQMHTKAKIELRGQEAVLRQAGRTLRLQILEPAGTKFEKVSGNPPPPQRQEPEVSKLIVAFKGQKDAVRLVVLVQPESAAHLAPPTLGPLANWPTAFGQK
ncbi:MAG: heparinase II/III family protein [Thermoguttaceae bacterium]|nr:heparinase II/III family protein [Thermoguttaceae bacterium]MDW8039689.1 heparinase II/III family protein [Thermoguttaceae bacterium]